MNAPSDADVGTLAETEEPERLKNRARELASDASREFLHRANETGSKGLSSVGRKLDEAAEFIEQRADEAAEKLHIDSKHVGAVAHRMHGAADYLKSHDPQSLLQDVDRAVKKHPYRALMIGAAVGYVVGRLFRRDR